MWSTRCLGKLAGYGQQPNVNFTNANFNLKTHLLSAASCAIALGAALGVNLSAAQTPARSDKILTIDELRVCMKLERSNKQSAAEIVQSQDAFKRDQNAAIAEQAEVDKANDALRARSAEIVADRNSVAALVAAQTVKAQAAKTDAEKADAEADRTMLEARNRALNQNIESFNATQQAQRDRINALNARIVAVNQRNKTINDRVEPHQQQVNTWRDQCGNRRFREEDEVVIKKELAAGS